MFFFFFSFLLSSLLVCSRSVCNVGSNPCELDFAENVSTRYFLPSNGYHCLDTFDDHFICTCPNNSSRKDRPCRLCDAEVNPCGISSSRLTCTEINRSYLCLCRNDQGEIIVSNQSCDLLSPLICLNGGIKDDAGRCHCPNGFTGDQCQNESYEQLCRGVNCFFDHPCGISRFGHTYRSKCFCRRGFQGEFCQSKGVLSNCSVSGCSSGGSCFEQLTGNQRWKFCLCQSGWIGNNCQKQYFRCSSVGFFVDQFFDKQGKYFQCRLNNNKEWILEDKSCPTGLRYNLEKQACRREEHSSFN